MELTIIVAIIAFLAVTLLLVGLLLFAKAKLTSSGEVTIDINGGEKVITTESGSTLLATLANNKVFLPSACGGGGSCGMCKCQVIEGGGDILPTETGFITRKMAKEHWRLGCQVKVKENLKIQVPEAVLGVKKWECTVVSNRNISTFLKEFVVKLPEGENLKFRSGGYIQIDIPKYDAIKFSDMDVDEAYRADWDKFKMWDLVTTNPEATFRAYSMANHPAEGNIIMLNIRIATPPFDKATGGFMKVNPGICSSYIFSRKPGDKVTISGPYGEFFLPDNLPDTQELIFIGGGAGMAPMRSHLMHLFKTEKTKRPVSFWYGARALKEAPYVDEFHAIEKEFPNFKFNLALDRPDPEADAAGVKYTPGFVHNVLYENYLKNHQAPEDCIYLMCGPPMMIASVVKMLDDHVAYIIGYEDGTVRPNGRITRAEVATIFFRLLTDDARQRNWSSENNFSDVSADKWYNNAVSTLCHMGVLGGYSDGTFRPNAPITRAEFAKIAVSFAQTNGSAVYSYFTDVKTTDWFAPYVTTAKDSGLIEGYSDGSFKPENRITRAEACAIVNRVLGRKPSKSHMKISGRIDWPDCTTADWFYEAIMEATNSHTYQMGKRVETWNDKLPQRDWVALEKIWSRANSR